MAQALVPLKDLVGAKTRLSGLLCPSERRAFAQAMVEDVLCVLTGYHGIDRVTLVSDDPGADLLARKYGIDSLDERSLGCRGLNRVLEAACDRIITADEAPVLVMHGDIPLLSAADLDAVLDEQSSCKGLVIGCDRLSTGTNLLAFTRRSRPRFSFGIDSCSLHQHNAREAGIRFSVMNRMGIALDVDEAEDVALLMSRLTATEAAHCADLLSGSELGGRLSVLLGSLDTNGQALAETAGYIA